VAGKPFLRSALPETAREVLDDVGALVDDVLREGTMGLWIVRLDQSMISSDPISAKHDKALANILARIL
jgi:hypothetical protein